MFSISIVNFIKTAIYSIKRHKIRIFLTISGIIIGISSVVVILSIGDGLNKKVSESITDGQLNSINISYMQDYTDSNTSTKKSLAFTSKDISELSEIDGVSNVKENDNQEDVGFKYSNIRFFDKDTNSCIAEYNSKKVVINLECGRVFNEGDSKNIILSNKDCKKLFQSPGEAIGKGVVIDSNYYEVIGVVRESSDLSYNEDESYLKKEDLKSIDTDLDISELTISIKNDNDKNYIGDKALEILNKNHKESLGEYKIVDSTETMKTMSGLINGITRFIAVVSGISLFVAGIGVMNIMYVSISERKREIGIRRAIGAYPKDILFQFLIEAIIVTALGGALGLALGCIITKIVGLLMPFSPVITVKTISISLGTSICTGVIFGIVPAKKAASMPPIKAIYR